MWQNRVKKTIFTLNVNNYSPEMTAFTYPLIQAYAKKIGADFHIITERKFPEWPITYEKLQIYELAQQMENDWNLYVDSDALVHPDTPDLTLLLPRDTVAHHRCDYAPTRWKTDRFFHRDGRHISSGNWLAVASDLCIELWKPVDDMTPAEAVANIQPSVIERTGGIVNAPHLIDDYILSRNIAKYGLKYVNIVDVLGKAYKEGGGFFYHHYLLPIEEKIEQVCRVLEKWQVSGLMKEMYQASGTSNPIVEAAAIPGWMNLEELRWLYKTAQEMESIVEIGSYKGRSTYALLSGCKGQVYAVDPFNEGQIIHESLAGKDTYDDFIKNVGHFPHLHTYRMTSAEAAADGIPPKVEMTFFDGDHSKEGLMADLKAWVPRTTKLICGHDLNDPNYPGVRQALYEYFGADRVASGPDSLWYIK